MSEISLQANDGWWDQTLFWNRKGTTTWLGCHYRCCCVHYTDEDLGGWWLWRYQIGWGLQPWELQVWWIGQSPLLFCLLSIPCLSNVIFLLYLHSFRFWVLLIKLLNLSCRINDLKWRVIHGGSLVHFLAVFTGSRMSMAVRIMNSKEAHFSSHDG